LNKFASLLLSIQSPYIIPFKKKINLVTCEEVGEKEHYAHHLVSAEFL